jgi:hypothetical protein
VPEQSLLEAVLEARQPLLVVELRSDYVPGIIIHPYNQVGHLLLARLVRVGQVQGVLHVTLIPISE